MNTSAAAQFLANIARLILNPIIALLFGLALIIFLWGVVKYIQGADNEKARSEGSHSMLWGLIGMAIMVTAFAIVHGIANTLGPGAQAPLGGQLPIQ